MEDISAFVLLIYQWYIGCRTLPSFCFSSLSVVVCSAGPGWRQGDLACNQAGQFPSEDRLHDLRQVQGLSGRLRSLVIQRPHRSHQVVELTSSLIVNVEAYVNDVFKNFHCRSCPPSTACQSLSDSLKDELSRCIKVGIEPLIMHLINDRNFIEVATKDGQQDIHGASLCLLYMHLLPHVVTLEGPCSMYIYILYFFNLRVTSILLLSYG